MKGEGVEFVPRVTPRSRVTKHGVPRAYIFQRTANDPAQLV